jgi:hypothetical protein
MMPKRLPPRCLQRRFAQNCSPRAHIVLASALRRMAVMNAAEAPPGCPTVYAGRRKHDRMRSDAPRCCASRAFEMAAGEFPTAIMEGTDCGDSRTLTKAPGNFSPGAPSFPCRRHPQR